MSSRLTDYEDRLRAKVREQVKGRKAGFLLGAGASFLSGKGYPLAAGLWSAIKLRLPSEDRVTIESAMAGAGPSLEAALDTVSVTRPDDGGLRQRVTEAIGTAFATYAAPLGEYEAFVRGLTAPRDLYAPVFTLNYDCLVEQAADLTGVPLADGFRGVFEAQFQATQLTEVTGQYQLRRNRRLFVARKGAICLHKLHGSLGWFTDGAGKVIRRCPSLPGPSGYRRLMVPPQHRKAADTGSLEGLLRDFVGLGDQRAAITVIDLSSVPFDVRPTVTAQIGRLAFEFNYWNPQYEEFPILLVCEEAHAYITRDSDTRFEGARKSMERIAKEGRKYGVGLAVVSQRPHELSETVLSQCGTFVCLRITNPGDQDYVRRLVPEAEQDLVNILAGLRRGEALILGEATPLPTRVQIDAPNPTPKSNDVDFYRHWIEGPEDLDVAAVVDRWRRQVR